MVTRPSKGNKYYISKSKGGYNPCLVVSAQTDNKGVVDSDFDVLGNCVGWATARFNEKLAEQGIISEADGCKYLGNTNAKNYVTLAKKQGLTVTTEPVQYGVMVWDDGKYGHVEFVESISADKKTCKDSSSAYATYILQEKTRKRDVGGSCQWGWNKPTKYLGCINPPVKVKERKGTLTLDGKTYEVVLKEI